MPCVAKKYECDVPELSTVVGATHGAGTVGETQGASTDDATRGAGASDAGLVPDAPVAPELAAEAAPDVDAVLTVREFGRLLRLVGVDCTALSEAPFDNPLGLSTGAATIFGRTGGVMEAALRSAAFLITGENPDFSACDTTAATPETPWMSRELAIGDATVRIAVASGLENTSKLLDALESGEAAFDFVEIMACPGGCVGGGGQPIQFNSELAQARAGVLNRLDAADKLRYSHENPDIAKLYADWIGEPLSHTAHEWLHTDQESWQICDSNIGIATACLVAIAMGLFPWTSTRRLSMPGPRRWLMSWLVALGRRARPPTETRVFARGLIEFTNVCKNDCYYCGIRRSNRACERYRLAPEQILACADAGWQAGFRTFVLQGGEDPAATDEWLAELIGALKAAHPGCAVTLSVGERSRESYRHLRAAGADRYLLRHETATAAHYRQLHPAAMTLQRRMACLSDLREAGFAVGAGFMVGSPFQTTERLAADLAFIQEFRPEMCGIGPFLPHRDALCSPRRPARWSLPATCCPSCAWRTRRCCCRPPRPWRRWVRPRPREGHPRRRQRRDAEPRRRPSARATTRSTTASPARRPARPANGPTWRRGLSPWGAALWKTAAIPLQPGLRS